MNPFSVAAELAAAAGLAAGAFVLGRRSTETRESAHEASASASAFDGRFDRLVDELPIAVILLDAAGVVTGFNRAAEDVFAVSAPAAVGRALIASIPSIDLERVAAAALRGDRVSRDLALALTGRDRQLSVRAYPSEGGATLLAVDRTRIAVLERVRSDFISNVSHELRTPLSAIKLMVETVLFSEGDAEAAALFLPQIDREVDRMTQLVSDLLELARSESGRLPLRKEVLELSDFARRVVATVERQADLQNVGLTVQSSEPVGVFADRDRLTQVLVNLLDNALRHTPAGGTVTVGVSSDGGDAVLTVRDTGVGIPYNDLPHIFERFYVVERSRNRERTGTGLGLSIARQLVEAHGGRISAESNLGYGSTFTCRLPRLVGAAAKAAIV